MRDARENGHYEIRLPYCKGCLVCVQECPTGCLEKAPELDFDEPDAVVRMETAFAPYDGAHAEQSAPIAQLIEEQIAAHDAARRAAGIGGAARTDGANGGGERA
jgi:formate hydrogenlyase subunit 6/NADH:ubiquinone oxidoreductase subunit I